MGSAVMEHRGVGRPSKYTDELAQRIIDRIGSGEDMLSICEDEDMPSRMTVWRWSRDNPEFDTRLARARSSQAHWLAQESIHRSRGAHDVGSASAARAFVDAARFVCPSFNRDSFGQRAELEVSVTAKMSDEQLDARIVELLAQVPADQLARLLQARPDVRALLPVVVPGEAREADGAAAPPPVAPNGAQPREGDTPLHIPPSHAQGSSDK